VSIPGYTDIAGLFDEVKIDSVELTIITGNDPSPASSLTNTGSAVIQMATDYNDKNAPTSSGDVQQYADVKSIRLANNFQYKEIIRPRFLTYALDSAGAPIASSPKQGFIRSNLDIEHYGKKGAFVLTSPGSIYTLWSFKYKFICRTAK